MSKYETLNRFERETIRLSFEDFAVEVKGGKSEERLLHDIRVRLSYSICNAVYKYRIVEGVTNAPDLTITDISEEDKDLIENLLTLYKYKYAGDSKDERLFLNIVYRKFDNLALKYY